MVLRNAQTSLEIMLRLLDCSEICILLYGSVCLKISTKMANKLEAARMQFYKIIQIIPWTEQPENHYENDNRKNIYTGNQDKTAWIPRTYILSNRVKGRLRETYVTISCELMAEGVRCKWRKKLIGEKWNRKLRRTIITYILKGRGTQKKDQWR